jgi:predicted transcriptional regulator
MDAIAGRVELLECLSEGLTDKRDIEDRLGKHRSTIKRWLDDLQDADIIASEAEGYQITAVGELAYREYRQFEGRFSTLVNVRPLLAFLPADVELGFRLLEGAEVLLSDEIAPHEPIHRLEDMVRKSKTRVVEGTSPVVLPRYVDFFHQQIMTKNLEAEFVLESTVFEYLLTAYHDEVTDIMDSGRGRFWSLSDRGLPYAMAVVEDEGVWVGVHGPQGGIRGAIINVSEDAIEWGRDQYNSILERAEAVEPSDVMLRSASV